MGSNRSLRIYQLNEGHPLNQLAIECLDGYPVDEDGELAVLTLIGAWWDELRGTKLLRIRGGPRAREVRNVLDFLSAGDPDAVMSYLTEIGGRAVLDVKQLRELDGHEIAQEILSVLISQLINEGPLPKAKKSKR